MDVIGSIYYLVFGFKGECANLVLRFKEKCTICRGELKNGDLLRQTSKIAICRGVWENRDSARAISFWPWFYWMWIKTNLGEEMSESTDDSVSDKFKGGRLLLLPLVVLLTPYSDEPYFQVGWPHGPHVHILRVQPVTGFNRILPSLHLLQDITTLYSLVMAHGRNKLYNKFIKDGVDSNILIIHY